MFSKLSVVVTSVLLTLAVATPTARTITPPTTPQDSPQCCKTVVSSSSFALSSVLALLGLDLTGLNVPIGLICSPITVLGNNCGDTTVTCAAPNKAWGGLIAINCIPITL